MTVIAAITLVSLSIPFVFAPQVTAAPNTKTSCESLGGSWDPRQERCAGYDRNSYCELSGASAAECGGSGSNDANLEGCGGVPTAIIKCEEDGTGEGVENTGVWGLLIMAIGILTTGVGIAALGGIIYGAVLYTSAGGSPDQIKKARTIFTNVVIGIISYAAMFALLQFIIPGGIFRS